MTKLPIQLNGYALTFTLLLMLTGCSDQPEVPAASTGAKSPTEMTVPKTNSEPIAEQENINEPVFKAAEQSHRQSIAAIQALKNKIESFVASPNEQQFNEILVSLEEAQTRFQIADITYHLDASLNDIRIRIDAFPMLPGYLDSVEGYPLSGLIHSEMPISLATLLDEHQFSDPYYLTLGFHPLRFMLKGDDRSPIVSWKRFIDEGTDKDRLAAERRRRYISLLARQLEADIQSMSEQWRANTPHNFQLIASPAYLDMLTNAPEEHPNALSTETLISELKKLRELLPEENSTPESSARESSTTEATP